MDKVHPDYYDLTVNVSITNSRDITFCDSLINADFITGNIAKYIVRHNQKNGLEDIDKAFNYCDIYLKQIEAYNSDKSQINLYELGAYYAALQHFILDSFTEEEKNKLENQGNDLALSLVLLKDSTPLIRGAGCGYKETLLDIIKYQLSLITDTPAVVFYKNFNDVMEDDSDDISLVMIECLEDFKSRYPAFTDEYITNSGFICNSDGTINYLR